MILFSAEKKPEYIHSEIGTHRWCPFDVSRGLQLLDSEEAYDSPFL